MTAGQDAPPGRPPQEAPAAARDTAPNSPRADSPADSPAGSPDRPADRSGEPADIDRVFGALADPTRRRLLQLLAAGRPASATTLAGEVTVSRQAVVQHLAVLERSRLVTGHRSGREVLFTVRPEPLTATASWMTHLAETWDERLRLLKQKAESAPRDEDTPAG